MFNFKKKAREIIYAKITTQFPQILPEAGKCKYNFMCHMNASHEAIKKGHDKIVIGFYIYNRQPILHFYNIDKNGKITDNTLGIHTLGFEHYFWKTFPIHYKKNAGQPRPNTVQQVENIFTSARKEIRNQLPWYLKPFIELNFV